jgi:two-component system NtrC family sensor kinase
MRGLFDTVNRIPLAYRVGLGLVVSLSLILGAFGFLHLQMQKQEQERLVVAAAERIGDVIRSSAHYKMLHNDRTALQNLIDNIGAEPGIRKVRIFNPQGMISFSSIPGEMGTWVDKKAEACYACHAQEKPIAKLEGKDRTRFLQDEKGERYLATIKPVENEKSCYTAACHVHPQSQRVLGVIDTQLSLAQVDESWRAHQWRMLGFWLVALLTVSGIAAAGFWIVATKTAQLEYAKATLVEREKLASLGKLAATVAHEINNPLFGIITYARLSQKDLQKGADAAKLADRLKCIERESQRCGDLIKNLLSFARSAPKGSESSDARFAIESALRLVNYRLKTQRIELEKELAPSPPPVACEQGPLEQLVLTLVVNAIEAMPHGGKLRVATTAVNGHLRIAVQDTGAGIPEEVLPRIFDPFFSTKDEPERTGLGLAVAKEIVESRHGTIEARNRPGGGAEFVVSLPAVEAEQEVRS